MSLQSRTMCRCVGLRLGRCHNWWASITTARGQHCAAVFVAGVPKKHETLTRCWLNVGETFTTLKKTSGPCLLVVLLLPEDTDCLQIRDRDFYVMSITVGKYIPQKQLLTRHLSTYNRHETLSQYCLNVGPASQTLAQH